MAFACPPIKPKGQYYKQWQGCIEEFTAEDITVSKFALVCFICDSKYVRNTPDRKMMCIFYAINIAVYLVKPKLIVL